VVAGIAEHRQLVRSVCRHAPTSALAGRRPAHPGQPALLRHIALRLPGFTHTLPLLVLFLLLLAASPLDAASRDFPGADNPLSEPRFTSVGVGIIPRYVVPTIAQDRAGFLWIATGDGLVRFDGYRFRPQERESPDPAARNLGWIRALLAGRDGRLWIGTESDGLAVYDPASETVTACSDERQDRDLVLPTIRALAEDAAGGIWVGSEGGGLQRFDPGSGHFARYRHSGQPGDLPDNRVQALLVDRQGTLWVGTWAGLSRRRTGSDRFEPVFSAPGAGGTNLAGRIVQTLFEASDGRIWAGTQQGDLAIVDPATSEGLLVDERPGSTTADGVSSLVEVPEGLMWAGRSSGIAVHDLHDGRLLQRLQHDPRRPASLAGNEVAVLMRDHSGLIWVGGYGLGLQRHDPNNRAIWLRSADTTPASPFAEADVRSVLRLGNGEIWTATRKGGVAVMDGQLRVIGAVWPQPPRPARVAVAAVSESLPPVRIEEMAQASDGTVWLGADSRLYQFTPDRRQLRSLAHDGGVTRGFLDSSDGALWVATQDGVYCLPPGASEIVRVAQQGGRPLRAEVNAVVEAPDQSVWVGTAKGLFRAPPGSRELQPVEAPAGAGLGNPIVIGLLFDRQQTLWLDTAVTGLHRMTHWDGQRATFEGISARHGIVNRPYGGNLLADARGRIWTQMYVYDPASDRLDELTAADGADLGTGWFQAHAQTADGRMLFGGSKGILVVRPERFDASTHQPPLLISELSIDGQRQPAGRIGDGLRLTPEQRSFSVSFAALDYSDPGRLRYAYQLQGFDAGWIETTADSRVASYSNLDPGDYVLRIRGSNRSGTWSRHELAIPVHVQPAWWQGTAFRLALAALALLMIYALVQLRTRQLRSRQAELKRIVRERTSELERLALALQRESAALAESSLTDPLTGLRNRRFLTQHVEADLALAVRAYESHLNYGAYLRDDAGLVFFLLDLDHFKQVNDHHGHAAGDAVLKQMSSRLGTVFRDSDYLVRWGGEEFLVVARATPPAHAAELAERARAAIADQPFDLDDGSRLARTCSIGFCCFPLSAQHADALDWNAMVNIADAALYAVKSAGRNGWLGALAAREQSAAALLARSRRPLAEWAQSGEIDLVCSAGLGGMTAAWMRNETPGTAPEKAPSTGCAEQTEA